MKLLALLNFYLLEEIRLYRNIEFLSLQTEINDYPMGLFHLWSFILGFDIPTFSNINAC